MKRRLVLAIAGVAGCAVLLFALPLAVVLQRSYRDEELLRLQRDTDAATRGHRPEPRARATGSSCRGSAASSASTHRTGRGSRAAGRRSPTRPTRSALRARAPIGTAPTGSSSSPCRCSAASGSTGAVRAQRSAGQRWLARAHRAWLALAGLGAGVVALAVLAALALGRRLAAAAGDAGRRGPTGRRG